MGLISPFEMPDVTISNAFWWWWCEGGACRHSEKYQPGKKIYLFIFYFLSLEFW